jgi:hypothetical protein
MTSPVSLPQANIGSPLVNMIDFISTSLVRSSFIRMPCVERMNPSTFPLILPLRFMFSLAPCGENSLTSTLLVVSFPSKSNSFSKIFPSEELTELMILSLCD